MQPTTSSSLSMLTSLLQDGPEYQKRLRTPFTPPKATLAEVHAAVPKELWQKSTSKSLMYVVRDIVCAVAIYQAGSRIDKVVPLYAESLHFPPIAIATLRWSLWCLYWFIQSVALSGLWTLGHEAGHGNLSPHSWVNHTIGFSLHTFLLVPYFNWRSTHHAHHKATNSIERDVNYVPRTRTHYNLPPEKVAQVTDYHELFEETPLYTLGRMLMMQCIGWQFYLFTDALGNPKYPEGTNLIFPSSPLFKPSESQGIIRSNIGVSVMMSILYYYTQQVGLANFIKLYLIPYLLVHHWIVMLTFLHHSDPTLPYYRGKSWTFLRGAVATCDRPLLGFLGRFFLHNISHDHVAHHLFSNIPFYNQPLVTEHIKRVLGDDYNYDSTNTFKALYRSFTSCCFIEDEGDIVFFKNQEGMALRTVSEKLD